MTRNTPTHVGKTASMAEKFFFRTKHPHARGEDLINVSSITEAIETPPRTWGRPLQMLRYAASMGNTPTHVGKTVPHP